MSKSKIDPSEAQIKRGARISDRLRRNGGRPDDRQVVLLTYESSLRDAANRSRSGEERAYSREMAAALHALLQATWPLFDSRLKQRAQQKRRAPVVTQPIIRRAAPRARRRTRRALSARAGPSGDSDGGGGGDPAAALAKFQRARVWASLPSVDRAAIIRALVDGGPETAEQIDHVLAEASPAGQCSGFAPLLVIGDDPGRRGDGAQRRRPMAIAAIRARQHCADCWLAGQGAGVRAHRPPSETELRRGESASWGEKQRSAPVKPKMRIISGKKVVKGTLHFVCKVGLPFGSGELEIDGVMVFLLARQKLGEFAVEARPRSERCPHDGGEREEDVCPVS